MSPTGLLVTQELLDGWQGNPRPSVKRGVLRRFDDASEQWVPIVPKTHDGATWQRPDGVDYGGGYRTPFEPYLGEGTIWQRDVVGAAMPLATDSATFAAWMASHINYGSGFGPTSYNSSVAGTHPIQCAVVDSRWPGTHYEYVNPVGGPSFLRDKLYGWVPWPRWFVPQAGQDSALAVFDIGTGELREYYLLTRVAGHDDRWAAVTGGYSIAPKDLEGWPDWNYPTQLAEGSSAVVRMHNHLGFIDIAGARRGVIDHAIAYTCANMVLPTSSDEAILEDGTRYTALGASWPALSGDGDTAGPGVPIHGQWARLPMSLDLSPTGPYPPFVRMVIAAIQTYGMVSTDSNNFVHAFNGEPGFMEASHLGVDPWATNGDLFQKFRELNRREGRSTTAPFDMASFPWALTEWAPRNWGKPD